MELPENAGLPYPMPESLGGGWGWFCEGVIYDGDAAYIREKITEWRERLGRPRGES